MSSDESETRAGPRLDTGHPAALQAGAIVSGVVFGAILAGLSFAGWRYLAGRVIAPAAVTPGTAPAYPAAAPPPGPPSPLVYAVGVVGSGAGAFETPFRRRIAFRRCISCRCGTMAAFSGFRASCLPAFLLICSA